MAQFCQAIARCLVCPRHAFNLVVFKFEVYTYLITVRLIVPTLQTFER
jgi:hypothetical protein